MWVPTGFVDLEICGDIVKISDTKLIIFHLPAMNSELPGKATAVDGIYLQRRGLSFSRNMISDLCGKIRPVEKAVLCYSYQSPRIRGLRERR